MRKKELQSSALPLSYNAKFNLSRRMYIELVHRRHRDLNAGPEDDRVWESNINKNFKTHIYFYILKNSFFSAQLASRSLI